MSVIASLDILLRASTDGLDKGLKKSLDALAAWRNKVSSTLSSVSSAVLTGLSAGAAAGAVQLMGQLFAGLVGKVAGAISSAVQMVTNAIQEQVGQIDNLAKTADKLGLGTEALAGLRHGAALAGQDAASLDNSIRHLQKNISEAATSGGDAAFAFNVLGLNAAKLRDLKPEEQIMQISDGFKEVTASSDRVRLAMQIFGREGASMINLLASGRKNINAAIAEAQRLGLGINRAEAAQVEAYVDAATRLKGAFAGIGRTLAIQFAPYLKQAADYVTELAVKFRKWVDDTLPYVVGYLTGLRDRFNEIMPEVVEAVQDAWQRIVQAVRNGVSKATETLARWRDNTISAVNKVADAFLDLADTVAPYVVAATDTIGNAAKTNVTSLQAVAEAAQDMGNKVSQSSLYTQVSVYGLSGAFAKSSKESTQSIRSAAAGIASALMPTNALLLKTFTDGKLTLGGIKDTLLTYAYSIEFVFTNWQQTLGYSVDVITLKVTQFGLGFVNIFNIMGRAVSGLGAALKELATTGSPGKMLDRYKQELMEVFNRPDTDFEKNLKAKIAKAEKEIPEDFAAFLDKKFKVFDDKDMATRLAGRIRDGFKNAFNQAGEGVTDTVKNLSGKLGDIFSSGFFARAFAPIKFNLPNLKPPKPPDINEPKGQDLIKGGTDNRPAVLGSNEALSIVYRAQGDKALATANLQLKTQGDMKGLLDKILKQLQVDKPVLAKARF